ncbi:MAG TPA: BON domain-containing protein [Candidatus Acidoferrales bacterium]|jgi:hyperosmotically inducible protein|nr:BON domain-containing protein [Candidatus Acidoferrales bacterium]
MSSYNRRNRTGNFFVFYLLPLALLGLLTMAARPQDPPNASRNDQIISREVYHQLALEPRLSVFDIVGFHVNGGTVTLTGEVTQPVKKSDAEGAVKGIEGVDKVDNQIKVLPLSPMDQKIREAEFHAIYSLPSLQKYSWYSVQSIHIIVDNGHVTLEGWVDNQADKDAANVRANSVSGVFSVKNNLQVGQPKRPDAH